MQGYNKRATVLFLLQRYQESIHDCKLVLDLNPYHFAAASGMGMCYRYAAAPRLLHTPHCCCIALVASRDQGNREIKLAGLDASGGSPHL